MPDHAGQLRHHAEHCRSLAESTYDDRMRKILMAMADEFDDQAAALDLPVPDAHSPG